jgi:ATP-dependent exoDNAse (exonuclease V) alpha subunit
VDPVEFKVGSLVMCTMNHNSDKVGLQSSDINEFDRLYYEAQDEWENNSDKGKDFFCRKTFSGTFFNGSIGNVEELYDRHVVVRLVTGLVVSVGYSLCYEYEYVVDKGELKPVPILAYDKLALIPARALTIHRSQGHSFDRVHIEVPPVAFAPGLLYVAASRVRTLAGLSVNREIKPDDVRVNHDALEFVESSSFRVPEIGEFDLE